MALLQTQAQGSAQIFHIVFIHRQIRVSCHTELGKLTHLAARKQICEVRAYHAGQRHKQQLLQRAFVGHVNQARQHARNLDNRNVVFTAKRITSAQPDNKVKRFVGHLRKGVRWIQPNGDQQRTNLIFEVILDPAALRRIAVAVRNNPNAVPRKLRHQGVVVQRILPLHHGMHRCRQAPKRLCRVGGLGLLICSAGQMQRRPDFKKLIEIGRNNTQKAQALKQWDFRASGPVQNPLVEGKNAVVPVQKLHDRSNR